MWLHGVVEQLHLGQPGPSHYYPALIAEPDRTSRRVGLWGVVSIGIGGMVGGGIFAVLGVAVQTAKGGAGGMIVFLAYEGFELIANAGEDVADPGRTLPQAYCISVLFVIVLYVLVATVSVGSVPVAELVHARDYALAVAARPTLGSTGFRMIAVAAMLSTASAINATLYGTWRLSDTIARKRELPERLEHPIWTGRSLGCSSPPERPWSWPTS